MTTLTLVGPGPDIARLERTLEPVFDPLDIAQQPIKTELIAPAGRPLPRTDPHPIQHVGIKTPAAVGTAANVDATTSASPAEDPGNPNMSYRSAGSGSISEKMELTAFGSL